MIAPRLPDDFDGKMIIRRATQVDTSKRKLHTDLFNNELLNADVEPGMYQYDI